jgi:hypothetical protein
VDQRETIAMLTWINQVDARVHLNQAAAETWAYALRSVDSAVAKQAVLEHYKAHENIAATPGAISKRAANIRTSREAGQYAVDKAREIEATTLRRPKTEADYRRKIRETPEFMALFEQGRREGNAMRAAATRAREGDQDQEWDAA